ncbi:MAG: helix-turn-helix transcriptional regulator [Verrucomicrobia bacterium]|nr:helix-turn-helix transcriptional regulator [Verrucomicrobiota bacterium]
METSLFDHIENKSLRIESTQRGVKLKSPELLSKPGLTSVVFFYHANESILMFNQTIKSLRIEKRLTLRDFCAQNGLDPSNWSKVERGVNPPPGDITLLERLADFFGLAGAKKLSFMDEAALQRGEIPADVADHAILQRALPAFFRAARGHELSEKELASLADDIKQLHTADA